MNRLFISAIFISAFLYWNLQTVAQNKTVSVPPKKEKRKRTRLESSIQKLETTIKKDEEVFNQLDDKIEGKIDEIIKTVTSIRDSQDSGRRALKLKEQVMKGLKNSILAYEQGKVELEKNLKTKRINLPADELQKITSDYDQKIEKRIDQVLQITASMTSFQGGSYSSEYVNTRRASKRAEKTKEKVVKELEKSIKKMEMENKQLEKTTAPVGKTNTIKDAEVKIQNNEKKIKARKVQINKVISKSTGGGQKVGRKGVKLRDKLIKQQVKEIRKYSSEMKTIASRLFKNKAKLIMLQKKQQALLDKRGK